MLFELSLLPINYDVFNACTTYNLNSLPGRDAAGLVVLDHETERSVKQRLRRRPPTKHEEKERAMKKVATVQNDTNDKRVKCETVQNDTNPFNMLIGFERVLCRVFFVDGSCVEGWRRVQSAFTNEIK